MGDFTPQQAQVLDLMERLRDTIHDEDALANPPKALNVGRSPAAQQLAYDIIVGAQRFLTKGVYVYSKAKGAAHLQRFSEQRLGVGASKDPTALAGAKGVRVWVREYEFLGSHRNLIFALDESDWFVFVVMEQPESKAEQESSGREGELSWRTPAALNMLTKYEKVVTEAMLQQLHQNNTGGAIVIKYTGEHVWSPGEKEARFLPDAEEMRRYVGSSKKFIVVDWHALFGKMSVRVGVGAPLAEHRRQFILELNVAFAYKDDSKFKKRFLFDTGATHTIIFLKSNDEVLKMAQAEDAGRQPKLVHEQGIGGESLKLYPVDGDIYLDSRTMEPDDVADRLDVEVLWVAARPEVAPKKEDPFAGYDAILGLDALQHACTVITPRYVRISRVALDDRHAL